ncbi:MAG: peptidylprolyl isomerase [Gemmatimonadales bacterium]
MTGWRVAPRLAVLLLAATAGRVAAQAPDSSTVDRIVAVVGTKAILGSQVLEEIYARQANGEDRIPDQTKDSAAFRTTFRRYVDTLVNFELMYNQAAADTSIKVTDQQVSDAVDALVQEARRRFTTQAEFLAQVHQVGYSSVEDWRTALREKQRRTLMVRKYEQQLADDNKIKPITPTEKEMRAFYDANIGMLPPAPASVSLRQIVVAPKPDSAAKARSRELADSLVGLLRKGADFATLARRFSMDEQSRNDGGNLPWYRHGETVHEFEDALFSLKVGQISDPVESPYGFHVIQVMRVAPGEVQARHILIIPDVDSTAQRAAHDTALAVAAALANGASFDSLQHRYNDPAEGEEFPDVPVDSVAHTPYGPVIANLDSGQVSQPFALPTLNQPVRTKWAVVQVTRRRPEGRRPFADLREQIRTLLSGMLGQEDYLNQLRQRTYVDIREP